MILVMLGTQNNSFHRLLEEIDKNIEDGTISEEVIVQAGYTKFNSKNMKIFDLIPKEKLEELQENASLIITHGGVGSIVSSIVLIPLVCILPLSSIPAPLTHKLKSNEDVVTVLSTYADTRFFAIVLPVYKPAITSIAVPTNMNLFIYFLSFHLIKGQIINLPLTSLHLLLYWAGVIYMTTFAAY